jgi:hypothetical protein
MFAHKPVEKHLQSAERKILRSVALPGDPNFV